MSPTFDHDLLAAARRALVLRDPKADPRQIKMALAWLDQSPENEAAFARVTQLLDRCDDIAADPALWAQPERPKRFPSLRRVLAIAASLVLIILGTAALTGRLAWRGQETAPHAMQFSSAAGEFKTIVLPDESTVVLSGESAVAIELKPRERHVNLARGEAFFEVAPDADRPFIVESGAGTATALGTAFNINRDDDGAVVTVIHGRVAVNSAGRAGRTKVILTPAMQVGYAGSGIMSPVRHVDLDIILARRSGTLTFSGQPLERVINEIDRYSPQPVVLADPALRSIPVTGSVNVGHLFEWLKGLEKGMGIAVAREENRLILRQVSPRARIQ